MNRTTFATACITLLANTFALAGCANQVDEDGTDEVAQNINTGVCTENVCAQFNPYAAVAHGSPSERHIIVDHIKDLFKRAEANSTIRGAIFSIDLGDISNEIIKATKSRKIDVSLVLDGCLDPDHFCKDVNKDTEKQIKKLVNHSKKKNSRLDLKFCNNQGRACSSDDPQGTQHAKYFTFSETKIKMQGDKKYTPASNVVWIGSANLTEKTGIRAFNDSLTFFNAPNLFKAINRYHRAQKRYEESESKVKFDDIGTTVYFFPAIAGNPLVGSLRKHYDQAKEDNCKISVAHQSFDLLDVAEVLKDFVQQKKCTVRILFGHGTVKETLLSDLDESESDGMVQIRPWERAGALHSKLITLEYIDSNNQDRKLVYTGSHNLTRQSTFRNDEILVEIENQVLYDGYSEHFNEYWNRSESQ